MMEPTESMVDTRQAYDAVPAPVGKEIRLPVGTHRYQVALAAASPAMAKWEEVLEMSEGDAAIAFTNRLAQDGGKMGPTLYTVWVRQASSKMVAECVLRVHWHPNAEIIAQGPAQNRMQIP